MSQKDSSSKNKTQPPQGNQGGGRRAGNTRYRMQAQQQAQEEVLKAAAEHGAPADNSQKAEQGYSDNQEMPSEDNVRGLWKSRVLASYKAKGPKDSQTLLAKVPEGKAVVQVSDHFKTSNVQEAMITTVDRMFDIFQNCAYEFNKIASGTELELNWIRPFLSKEVTTTWHQGDGFILVFSGRISTRRWTMVVKGTQEEVLVFILPTDKLIGFALSHKNFKPYFSMTPLPDDLDVRWKVAEHPIKPEQFPQIYKELFDALIRFARDEARLDEVFNLRVIGVDPVKTGPTSEEELARQKYYQDQFFHDSHGDDLLRDDFEPQRPYQAPPRTNSFTGSAGEDGLNRPAAQISPLPPFQDPTQRVGMGASGGAGVIGGAGYPPQGQVQAAQSSGGWQPVPTNLGPGPVDWQEQARQEQARQEQARQEQARQEQARQEQARQEQARQEQARQDPSWEDQSRQDLSRNPFSRMVEPTPPGSRGQLPQMPLPPPMPMAPPAPQQQQMPSQAHLPSGPPLPPQMRMPPQMPNPMAPAAQMPPEQPITSQQHLHHIQSHLQPAPAQLQQMIPAPQITTAQTDAPAQTIQQADSLEHILTALIKTLDKELEVVAKAGADAFAQRDLNRADAALKFSERLTEFRSVAHELLSYYRDR